MNGANIQKKMTKGISWGKEEKMMMKKHCFVTLYTFLFYE